MTTVATSSKFRDIKDILNDPMLRSKLNNIVDEICNEMAKIAQCRQVIKDLKEAAKTDLEINPKILNSYAKISYDNNFTAVKQEVDQMEYLLETVMGLLNHEPN